VNADGGHFEHHL